MEQIKWLDKFRKKAKTIQKHLFLRQYIKYSHQHLFVIFCNYYLSFLSFIFSYQQMYFPQMELNDWLICKANIRDNICR